MPPRARRLTAPERPRTGPDRCEPAALGLGLVLATLAPGCVPEAPRGSDRACSQSTQAALYGADADAALDAEWLRRARRAIVPLFERGEPSCTASVVAEGWALTAAHCAATDASALALGSATESSVTIAVERVALHPQLDAALLGFDHASPGPCVEPLRLARDAPELGSELWLAGLGLQETGASGTLEVAAEIVAAVDDTHLWVDGGGASGGCVGDSGGPLLRVEALDHARIVGVLHQGSASCRGYDAYVRADRLEGWIADVIRSGR